MEGCNETEERDARSRITHQLVLVLERLLVEVVDLAVLQPGHAVQVSEARLKLLRGGGGHPRAVCAPAALPGVGCSRVGDKF